jgi:hypothetical protein
VHFFWSLELSTNSQEELLIKPLIKHLVSHIKQVDLVRDDLHVLKGQRLHACPWKAFEDPALILALTLFNVVLD